MLGGGTGLIRQERVRRCDVLYEFGSDSAFKRESKNRVYIDRRNQYYLCTSDNKLALTLSILLIFKTAKSNQKYSICCPKIAQRHRQTIRIANISE